MKSSSPSSAIVKHTFWEALKSKWLILYTVIFVLLAVNVPIVIVVAREYLASNYLDHFLTYLVTDSFPFLPLLALPIGALSIVDEKESGTLQYVLSTPISKGKFLASRILGLLLATNIVLLLGYGIDSLYVFQFDFPRYWAVIYILLAAVALNACTLGMSLLVSIFSRRKAAALGAAIFIWFFLTVLSDFGDLAVVLSFVGAGSFTVPLILLNPVESSRLLGVFQLNPGFTELGGTGLAARYYLGDAVTQVLALGMLVWIAVVYSLCFAAFAKRDLV